MLNFMRTGRLVLPVNFDDYDTLIAEAKFYELDEMVKQLEESSKTGKQTELSPQPAAKQKSVYDDLEESGLSKAKQTALILRSAFSKTASKSWTTSTSMAQNTGSATSQRSSSTDEENSSSSPKSVNKSASCKMVIVNVETGKCVVSGERRCLVKLVPEIEQNEVGGGVDTDDVQKYLSKCSVELSLVEIMERLYSNEFTLEALHSNEYIFMCNKSNKF